MMCSNVSPENQYAHQDEVVEWFRRVDVDGSGRIDTDELQAALLNSQGQSFSRAVCRRMIAMFDKKRDGTIDLTEFRLLYNYVSQWMDVFRLYDKDGSGYIEEDELGQAFQQMGFRFSPAITKLVVAIRDRKKHCQLTVDQFIEVCIQIHRLTEAFKNLDNDSDGVIKLGFEDYLEMVFDDYVCN